MRRSGKIVRPVLRFVASVLITSGILMLIDAVLTVTWQEPVSAYFAHQDQNRLNHELKGELPQVALDKRLLGSVRDEHVRLERLAGLARGRAHAGHAIGRISLPKIGAHYAVVQGTDTDSLRKGPGHYPDTNFPGEGGTVAIAGHRTTYGAPFNKIDKLKHGDQIVLEMPYGRFVYAVDRTKIVQPTDLGVVKRVPGPEQLVLSACHPLYSAAQRIIVFARLKTATAN
ncbi:MAG: sortase [Thermoleophilaceae bacterium]|jgi:sortase A|nr:sortase [Thermoleophilaceae bacterium]MEA2437023.1 sortase [Thermoleophilaceae bacterium]